jgi:hypothetical protein
VLDADDAFALDVARSIARTASVDIVHAFDDTDVRRTKKSLLLKSHSVRLVEKQICGRSRATDSN